MVIKMTKKNIGIFTIETAYIVWLAYVNCLKMRNYQYTNYLLPSFVFAPIAVLAMIYLLKNMPNCKNRLFALSLFLFLNIFYLII
jgi:hypothetical protein